jgi:hypothetical protein
MAWIVEAGGEEFNESKLVNTVSFNGGAETDKHLTSMLGKEIAKVCFVLQTGAFFVPNCHEPLK